MSKFKKIIVVTVCLILLVVPFSVSATVGGDEINGQITIDDFEIVAVGVTLDPYGDAVDYYDGTLNTYYNANDNKLRLGIEQFGNGATTVGDGCNIGITIQLKNNNSKAYDTKYSVSGSFKFGIRKGAGNVSVVGSSRHGTSFANNGNTYLENATLKDVSTDWGLYYQADFKSSAFGECYDTYSITLNYTVTGYGSSYAKYIYLYDFNFKYTTKEDFYSQQIDNSIDKHTDKVVENQNENTDKILNDWDGGKNVDDGTADNFKNAEEEALGGKTDEQIKNEINNSIDFNFNVFDSAKIGKMHYLFDSVLNVCGGTYQALFMLCLTLGLAAFLIGRRYR